MVIVKMKTPFTVMKIKSEKDIPFPASPLFFAKTAEELSLVCPTKSAPETFVERSDGWRCFKIAGVLDFSLVGILAKISGVLAKGNIPIFAVSTFNTDYILVKEEFSEKAEQLLSANGFNVTEDEIY